MRCPGRRKSSPTFRDEAEVVSSQTAARVMRQLGLRGIYPKQWRTITTRNRADTDADPPAPVQVDATGRRTELHGGRTSPAQFGRSVHAVVVNTHSRRSAYASGPLVPGLIVILRCRQNFSILNSSTNPGHLTEPQRGPCLTLTISHCQ